jgi:HSP20 family molecular chaperone IbpA
MWSFDSRAGASMPSALITDGLFFPWAADLGDLGALAWREDGEAYVLEGRLHGFEPTDVHIDVHGRALEIRAERGCDRERHGARSFRHRVTLPRGADADAMAMTFEDGMLSVRVPKAAARRAN